MPNMIAYGALLAWPLITLALFLSIPPRRAIVWAILVGYLLLPVQANFNLPAVPDFDKDSIPCVATFFLALCFASKDALRLPKSLVVNCMMIVFVFSPILTGLNNRDFLNDSSTIRQGITLYDSIAISSGNIIMLMPFLLGFNFFKDEKSQKDILKIFVISAIFYSVLILWELKMSPQLETKIYNVGTIEFFVQQMRGNGYRSKVFMGHGLLVATFCSMAILASIGLWKIKQKTLQIKPAYVVLYLSVILILNKSTGAFLLTATIGPLIYFLSPKRFASVAFIFAAVIVTYPALRGAGLIPTEQFLSASEKISEDRSNSLAFRLRNEDELLARAGERPWFGWGGYSRNRVYKTAWWGGGADTSVTDGTWVIVIGTFGWVGYFAEFGLLCYPFLIAFRLRRQLSIVSATLASMHLLNLIDLIPNSSLRPITWLIAGTLSGMVASRKMRTAPRFAAAQSLGQARKDQLPA